MAMEQIKDIVKRLVEGLDPVIAVLLTKRPQYSKHSAVISFFDKEFIKTGILPKEYSRTLNRAF